MEEQRVAIDTDPATSPEEKAALLADAEARYHQAMAALAAHVAR